MKKNAQDYEGRKLNKTIKMKKKEGLKKKQSAAEKIRDLFPKDLY